MYGYPADPRYKPLQRFPYVGSGSGDGAVYEAEADGCPEGADCPYHCRANFKNFQIEVVGEGLDPP